MRPLITGILVGILLAAGGYWVWHGTYQPPVIAQTEEPAEAMDQSLEAKLEALELRADAITKELAATGRVVRRRARDLGSSIADTVADTAITAEINAKLAADPEVSAWHISVNTTSGVVTLSGTASSAGAIGRAMLAALQTEGVNLVISTVQVRPSAPQDNAESNTQP